MTHNETISRVEERIAFVQQELADIGAPTNDFADGVVCTRNFELGFLLRLLADLERGREEIAEAA